MGTLDGKTAVVASASRGLGLAIAQAYSREGAPMVLSGRSRANLERARREPTPRAGIIASQSVKTTAEMPRFQLHLTSRA